MVRRIAVIGAGPSGLITLHHLSKRPDLFELVAFEQAPQLGGVWLYTERTGTDEFGIPVHSSCYKNLKTKFSHHVMGFSSEFPFPNNQQYFSHEDVLNYLKTFTKKAALEKYIQFSSHVERVNPVKTKNNGLQWEVDVRNLTANDNSINRYLFDVVVVCNGHYAVPRIPADIRGLNIFQGRLIHSHDYRTPEPYTGTRVAILGRGSSGAEILLDLAPYVAEIYWCHHSKPLSSSSLPPNAKQLPAAIELKQDSLIVKGDREIKVDAVIMATGYRYSLPFLTPDCHVMWEDGVKLKPLYKHIIHTEFSDSLFFIGAPTILCGFPQLNGQAQFLLAVLNGTVQLPSKQEMDEDIEVDFKRRTELGVAVMKPMALGPTQWDYHNELARMAKFTPIAPALQSICQRQFDVFFDDIVHFREIVFDVFDANDPKGYREVIPAAVPS